MNQSVLSVERIVRGVLNKLCESNHLHVSASCMKDLLLEEEHPNHKYSIECF